VTVTNCVADQDPGSGFGMNIFLIPDLFDYDLRLMTFLLKPEEKRKK
jgi:hypothetical protein